jgi:tRNA (guanine-N7-)-methyltransferase
VVAFDTSAWFDMVRHGSTSSPTAHQPLTNRSVQASSDNKPGIFFSGNRLILSMSIQSDPLKTKILEKKHAIRSFTLRRGRITVAQQRALNTLWPRYGIEINNIINLDTLFGRGAEKHLEIGFGRGDALITMATRHPEHDYLGIEVHKAGIGHLLLQIEAHQLTNIRIICADASEILQDKLPSQSLDAIYLFFPDPWHKKRHHKRRLIQPPFVNLLAQRLKSGGILHLATDWENYAQQMLQILEMTPEFRNCVEPGHFAPRPLERFLTKFEQRGLRLGHSVWDLLFVRR